MGCQLEKHQYRNQKSEQRRGRAQYLFANVVDKAIARYNIFGIAKSNECIIGSKA